MLENPTIVYIWIVIIVIILLVGGYINAVSFHRDNGGSALYKPYKHAAVWSIFASTFFSFGILLHTFEVLFGERTFFARGLVVLFFLALIIIFEKIIFYFAQKKEPGIEFSSWKVWE